MFEGRDQSLLEALGASRIAPAERLRSAFAEHERTGRPLAEVAIAAGVLDRPGLLRAVAEHLGAEFVADLPADLPAETVALLDERLARTYGVAPLRSAAAPVAVLAVDPVDGRLVGDLAFATGREVRLAVADPARVAALIRQHYGEERTNVEAAAGRLEAECGDSRDGALTETDLERMAGRTPIVHFVNLVLTQAIRDRASDIHFEPFEHEFKIRYRIDGTLHEMTPPPRTLALPIVSRVKVLANLDIAEHRVPQDGRIKLIVADRAVDLRVSTLPTQFGESVVLRVLDQSALGLDLTQLSMPAPVEQAVRDIVRRPNGFFVVTGPTGSGKTTTLYSCLKLLNTPDVKILTVEDPVEYEIDGIMQVPVNYAADLSFARALRAFLRQDPDIVMVGEIRDLETAQIAIQASLTGHLVLSTLHTNDAAGAVTRLTDMGIEPFLLASTLEAVLAQRLVRRICPECRVPCEPAEAALRQAGFAPADLEQQPLFFGRGCAACHHTGYRGRVGLFELLRMSEALRDEIVAGASLVQLRRTAIAEGMAPLRTAGLNALVRGETSLEELTKYV